MRHDDHELLRRRNDTAQGMYGHLLDRAIDGSGETLDGRSLRSFDELLSQRRSSRLPFGQLGQIGATELGLERDFLLVGLRHGCLILNQPLSLHGQRLDTGDSLLLDLEILHPGDEATFQ